jgi:flavin reductase (DIM6/NTAB) family NADH-FMN oxidoreductase RutF
MQTISLGSASGTAVPHVNPDALRGFMSGYFTGVAVVTSVDGDDRPHGLTCNSLVSVTLEPPTLLVCLHAECGTLAAVHDHGGFAVNLLGERSSRVAEVFASTTPDRFDLISWKPAPLTGLPVLVSDAFAVAECAVADQFQVGDHAVLLGRVVEIDTREASPLLYGWRSFSGPPAARPRGTMPGSGPEAG